MLFLEDSRLDGQRCEGWVTKDVNSHLRQNVGLLFHSFVASILPGII